MCYGGLSDGPNRYLKRSSKRPRSYNRRPYFVTKKMLPLPEGNMLRGQVLRHKTSNFPKTSLRLYNGKWTFLQWSLVWRFDRKITFAFIVRKRDANTELPDYIGGGHYIEATLIFLSSKASLPWNVFILVSLRLKNSLPWQQYVIRV